MFFNKFRSVVLKKVKAIIFFFDSFCNFFFLEKHFKWNSWRNVIHLKQYSFRFLKLLWRCFKKRQNRAFENFMSSYNHTNIVLQILIGYNSPWLRVNCTYVESNNSMSIVTVSPLLVLCEARNNFLWFHLFFRIHVCDTILAVLES